MIMNISFIRYICKHFIFFIYNLPLEANKANVVDFKFENNYHLICKYQCGYRYYYRAE